MNNKPTFKYNIHGIKSSSDTYRNINGVHFAHYTSNPVLFDKIKVESKKLGVKVRIINQEIYVEKGKIDLINITG